jgi:hypothetical protein
LYPGTGSGRVRGFMRSVAICVALVTFAACGPSVSGDDDDDVGIDARVDAATDGNNIDGEEIDFSKVYAHSGQVLYRLDTTTLAPVEIGPFNIGVPSITDIAVDKNDRMLGISLDNIYTIDVATGAATLLVALPGGAPNLTSLSFVPIDLQNPDSAERLVAATDQGDVLEINQQTGATSPLGSYGSTAGGLIRSSGDIVAITGLGIFATVTIGDTLTDPDYLAVINPNTWAATPLGVGTGHDRIFGVGFWRNKIYGFVDTGTGGAIVELDRNTGASSPVNTGTIRWFGAGVTTDAPVID